VFALVGAIYIATKNFSPAKAATLIGATQMFGMAGGSAGQFLVGPLIGGGVKWNVFWAAMGIGGLLIGVMLFALLRKTSPPRRPKAGGCGPRPTRSPPSSRTRSRSCAG
jgi:MFS family permease